MYAYWKDEDHDIDVREQVRLLLRIDWRDQIWKGASALLHGLVLFLAFFAPGTLDGVSFDIMDDLSRTVAFEVTPAQQRPERERPRPARDDAAGKPHSGPEGAMGRRDSPRTDNRAGHEGPRDNRDPRLARETLRDLSRTAGILSVLSPAAPVSPFGGDLGMDPESALGTLLGNQIGDNLGYGGLGLHGTGRGGGRTGEGTIGVGILDTIGRDGRNGKGPGGPGGPALEDHGHRPVAVTGIATGLAVHGSLDKDTIRRIVHRHLNEVKFCYESALAKSPDLSGRVSIRFMITGTGAVQMSAVADSTLADPAVAGCIAAAVRRWAFPAPDGGGVVVVTYPFQLESSLE
jgi:hypothetical protein